MGQCMKSIRIAEIHSIVWMKIGAASTRRHTESAELVDHPVGRSVGRPFCWSVGRFFGRSAALSVGHSVGRSFGHLVGRSFGRSAVRSVD